MKKKIVATFLLLTLPLMYVSMQSAGGQWGTPDSAYAEIIGIDGWERVAYDIALAAACATTGAGWLVCVAAGSA
ncbi:MAG: hypothetical protein L0Z53_07550 [Acidobacteriales bacterium]|nr:hypothetical protein [Terriglobales bacterium]